MMHRDVLQGRANVCCNLADHIKHVIDELGFSYIRNNQFDILPNFLASNRE